jgi:uncharacterized protein YacL
MVLTFLRALFILLMGAVGWYYVKDTAQPFSDYTWLSMAIAVVVSTLLICVDILSPRQKLAIFSGVFCGLIVGVAFSFALSFVVQLLTDHYMIPPDITSQAYPKWKAIRDGTVNYIDLTLGISCCYLAISFILQTKDDFRFVIPYVEFSKQMKGARPILLDTSVLIDGRILDMAQTGILESQLIVPRFVLDELHAVADSADKLHRTRGRLGLEVLNKLQKSDNADVVLYEGTDRTTASNPVDQQLIQLAKTLNARVLTNDFNLNKVAQLRGVTVINLNALANAMKPVVKVGEKMKVTIQKPGDLPGQGVGYLEDGTMVVVEQARSLINAEVEVTVTNTRQTAAGRMIFGRLGDRAA